MYILLSYVSLLVEWKYPHFVILDKTLMFYVFASVTYDKKNQKWIFISYFISFGVYEIRQI